MLETILALSVVKTALQLVAVYQRHLTLVHHRQNGREESECG